MTYFEEKVYNITMKIPRGRVATYTQIARAIGKPKAVRAVGQALSKNFLRSIPCHRVICQNGKVGGYNRGLFAKIRWLKSEGIDVRQGLMELTKYRWKTKKFWK